MKKLFSCSVFILLAGCATSAKYEAVLDSWIGSSELEIVRSWGPPAQAYETGGRKFLVYTSSRNVVLPGTAPTYTTNVVGNTAYTNSYGGTPAQNLAFSCETTFELSKETIVSWSYRGNDCTAF
ncbi:hypothetical protein [Pygmaiobacter massiliensis]|uniref:hypothetical protein n=1 Tax=Pygmaiobacter massiliensis TaxID=1917873 RepID=UPI0028A13519|nr:hypothetical protein [Pygmaiobacter massiliensis]